ncbi:hypothetical protein MF672_033565 [Actinomadura sp. ATCC 31491]|uniref:Uncharacterized protein n=1 Tax=Actinomadura luzonensis TaxID=2805427 RepID=A0ABT0G2P8_9ACTN|nr:hypothetical protein [Actinomadura luzonensis]MCK2218688.1 hypothetical protein [Actinomadura luzonensis]
MPGSSDLWYVSPYRELWTAGGGAEPIAPVRRRPTAASCAAELRTRQYQQVAMADMKAGGWACARTAEHNVVAVRIAAIPPRGDENAPLDISYTVWQQ